MGNGCENRPVEVYAPAKIVIAGVASGCGKTTVSSGLMAAYTQMGLNVAPFKVGPDYIDPTFHEFVTGNVAYNLDTWLQGKGGVQSTFARFSGVLHDICIIEGVMGLFDGVGGTLQGSTAEIASLIDAPVLLVVDGRGMALSSAALVAGYAFFKKQYPIAGIIFNNLSSEKQYKLLATAVNDELGVACFGYIRKNPEITLHRQYFGLIPPEEIDNFARRIALLAKEIMITVDLNGILELARRACPISLLSATAEQDIFKVNKELSNINNSPMRLGIFMDKAFNAYYQDDLQLFKDLGVELVTISPLADQVLPIGIDGLYIGSGFTDVFAHDLSNNHSFRHALRLALENGLPAYAECGGLLYLMDSLENAKGEKWPMTGFFSGQGIMTKKLVNFGYATLTFLHDTLLGVKEDTIKIHEFHRSSICSNEEPVARVYKETGESWDAGLHKKNVLAWFPHVRFSAALPALQRFLSVCKETGYSHKCCAPSD